MQLLPRSLLGTLLFSAALPTATYRAQVRTITVLAQRMDALNPQALARTQSAAQAATCTKMRPCSPPSTSERG